VWFEFIVLLSSFCLKLPEPRRRYDADAVEFLKRQEVAVSGYDAVRFSGQRGRKHVIVVRVAAGLFFQGRGVDHLRVFMEESDDLFGLCRRKFQFALKIFLQFAEYPFGGADDVL